MTRTQALEHAISVLKDDKDSREAVSMLYEIKNEIMIKRWTASSIRDAVEQFIIDNGRLPKASEFGKNGIPTGTAVKNIYSKTVSEWLYENYPEKKSPVRKYTEDFIHDYFEIEPKSQYEFNKNRKSGTKAWQTVAKCYNLTSWNALLKKLELPKFRNAKKRISHKYRVHINHDIEFSAQEK